MVKKIFPALLALVLVPPLLFLIFVASSPSAGACVTAGGDVLPTGPGLKSGPVSVAQANIKYNLGAGAFRSDLARTVEGRPDFVSLNEQGLRSNAAITPNGYALHRDEIPGDLPRSSRAQFRSTAVLWRTDRWSKVTSGTIVMVRNGPRSTDDGRAATWATLTDVDGAVVSVVSVHHMVNPVRIGPNKPLRQQLYRKGMEQLAALVDRLSDAGPVIVMGDFNSQWAANDPWGPRALLGPVGMKSTMDVKGKVATEQGGGAIDYIFFTTNSLTVTRQWTAPLSSDHNLLGATLQSTGMSTGTGTGSGSTKPVDLQAGATVAGLNARQTRNAASVVAEGRARRVAEQGIVIALAVASRESGFKNYANDGKGGDLKPDQRGIERSLRLPHEAVGTDHGSLGIMQQQWPWWGTMEQLMNPRAAAGLFYDALLKLPGWQTMPVTVAAQKVQRSAYPDAYASHEKLARQILAQIDPDAALEAVAASTDAACASTVGDVSCPPTKSPAEKGLTPDALLVLRCVDSVFGSHTYGGVGNRALNAASDHPAGRAVDIMIADWQKTGGIAEGDAIAAWVIEHQKELGVTYVIWRARIWSGEGWRPYRHPSGATDPTNMHMDHVHVSVKGNAGTGFPAAGAGAMVFPLPPGSYTDQKNYGRTGSMWASTHTGDDLAAPCGTPIVAVHAGTIEIRTGLVWPGPWLVSVKTGKGTLSTSYAHMSEVSVTDGQRVQAGQVLGRVGDRGNAKGCHLHLEVRPTDTTTVDPSPWLAQNTGARRAA